MYKINQRPTQVKLGVGFIALSIIPLITKSSPTLDFMLGAGFAIGLGLLIAAIARLKVIPEKKA
jgi:hypothetical protein